MLLRGIPEPVDPQERAVYQNLRVLVEAAAVQQAESSASRLRHVPSLPNGGAGGGARWFALLGRHYSRQVRLGRQQLRLGLTWRLLRIDHRYTSGPVRTRTLIASSATSIVPGMTMTSTGQW